MHRPRFRPFRKARFFLIQTVALWLCLMLICLTSSGFTQGEVVVMRALEHLGKPYVLGAAGPDRFDCSGLVMYCLTPEGFEFPYHSAEIIGTDERYPLITNPRDLLAGDVICFDTVQDRDPSDHMGFWIGGNRFVHASSTGEVKISALEDFYLERFTGARRYVQVYTYLPTGKQIGEWFEGTGIPEKLRPVREWIDSLQIAERLKPVRDWFDSLQIREKIDALKGKITDLWNSFFRKP
ncbi:MAG: C40 family peptidase [Clostridia bacterium]|nr:C40 family peptidase [Clostridia bacterium]MBR3273926.1 C40 family peptidase [Clostridia bacterium]